MIWLLFSNLWYPLSPSHGIEDCNINKADINGWHQLKDFNQKKTDVIKNYVFVGHNKMFLMIYFVYNYETTCGNPEGINGGICCK